MYVLFHGDPYGGLLLMFVFGVLALMAVFITTRKMFGKGVALVTFFLLAISPLITTQSRFMWNHHPTTFFIVLVLYFAYMIVKNPRVYAPLAVFTAGLIYHFELAISVPVMVTLFIALPFVYRIKDVPTYIYSVVAGVLAFSPFLLFESRHGWMAMRSVFSYMLPQGPVGRDVWYLRIIDHTGPYISNAVNSFATEHGFLPYTLFTILPPALLIALGMFTWKAKDKTHRIYFRFLLLLLVISYGVLLFLNNSIWDYYLIHAHVIYIFVFAYSVTVSYRAMHKSPWAKAACAILTLFILSMAAASAWRMKINFLSDFHDVGGVEKILGKKFAIDYVYRDAKGKAFSEFTFMAPIYTYPYDYLFKTYGNEKYGYMPGNLKKGLVYLIIEPDASKPWTYKGWLETVIVGGDIVETKTLFTGHIIQKRLFP